MNQTNVTTFVNNTCQSKGLKVKFEQTIDQTSSHCFVTKLIIKDKINGKILNYFGKSDQNSKISRSIASQAAVDDNFLAQFGKLNDSKMSPAVYLNQIKKSQKKSNSIYDIYLTSRLFGLTLKLEFIKFTGYGEEIIVKLKYGNLISIGYGDSHLNAIQNAAQNVNFKLCESIISKDDEENDCWTNEQMNNLIDSSIIDKLSFDCIFSVRRDDEPLFIYKCQFDELNPDPLSSMIAYGIDGDKEKSKNLALNCMLKIIKTQNDLEEIEKNRNLLNRIQVLEYLDEMNPYKSSSFIKITKKSKDMQIDQTLNDHFLIQESLNFKFERDRSDFIIKEEIINDECSIEEVRSKKRSYCIGSRDRVSNGEEFDLNRRIKKERIISFSD